MKDTDLLVVNRDGVDYKITAEELKEYLKADSGGEIGTEDWSPYFYSNLHKWASGRNIEDYYNKVIYTGSNNHGVPRLEVDTSGFEGGSNGLHWVQLDLPVDENGESIFKGTLTAVTSQGRNQGSELINPNKRIKKTAVIIYLDGTEVKEETQQTVGNEVTGDPEPYSIPLDGVATIRFWGSNDSDESASGSTHLVWLEDICIDGVRIEDYKL